MVAGKQLTGGRFWGGIREPSAEQKCIISSRCQRHELRRTQCKESGEVEQRWCGKDKNSAASVLLSEKALVAQKFRLIDLGKHLVGRPLD